MADKMIQVGIMLPPKLIAEIDKIVEEKAAFGVKGFRSDYIREAIVEKIMREEGK